MSARGQAERIGALSADSARAILVIAATGELAVALRERIDRGLAVVRDVRPGEMSEGLGACRPWPWMVVGEVAQVSATVRATLCARPVLVFWRGAPPDGLPKHVRRFPSFSGLADAVAQALGASVAGLRLAPGVGVELPDGRISRSLELQALVGAHPHPFHLPRRAFGSGGRALARRGVLMSTGTAAGRGVVLVPAGDPTRAQR